MAGIQDVFQAFQLFKEGVQSIAVQQAFNNANQQVQQIRNQQLEEAEQLEQIRGVAGNLTRQLISAGAPAAQIQLAQQSLLPPQPTEQELIQLRGAEQERVQRALIRERAQQERRTLLAEAPGKQGEKLIREIDKFDKRADIRALREAGESVDRLENLLDQAAGDETAANAAFELSKIGLVKLAGESGRLSDQDINRAGANPSAIRAASRAVKRFAVGKPTKADISDFKNMVNSMKQVIAISARKKARGFSNQRARVLPNINADQLNDALLEALPQPVGEPAKAQGQTVLVRDPESGQVFRFQSDSEGLKEALRLGGEIVE